MANAVEPSESTLSGGELVGIHNDTFRRVVVPVCCLGIVRRGSKGCQASLPVLRRRVTPCTRAYLGRTPT